MWPDTFGGLWDGRVTQSGHADGHTKFNDFSSARRMIYAIYFSKSVQKEGINKL